MSYSLLPKQILWLSLRFSVTLTLFLLFIIGAVRLNSPDSVAQALFLDACANPCPLGLTTGLTTYDQTRQLLEQHPYVQNMTERNTVIRWQWTDAAPAQFRRDTEPTITFTGNVVNVVHIATTIPRGVLYADFGVPDETLLDASRNQRGYFVAVNDFYEGLRVQNFIDCPARRANMLHEPVTLTWFGRSAEDFITESSFALRGSTPRQVCEGSS